jgi:hypothetical protein
LKVLWAELDETQFLECNSKASVAKLLDIRLDYCKSFYITKTFPALSDTSNKDPEDPDRFNPENQMISNQGPPSNKTSFRRTQSIEES